MVSAWIPFLSIVIAAVIMFCFWAWSGMGR